MKDTIIALLILLVMCLTFGLIMEYERPDTPVEAIEKTTVDDLMDAIEQVESGGDVNAVGEAGELGCMQIRKIYVDDVNRILGHDKYTYGDRRDRAKSRKMTEIYIYHYAIGIVYKVDDGLLEVMARIHNGGPNGYKKESTLAYWEKVKAVLYE